MSRPRARRAPLRPVRSKEAVTWPSALRALEQVPIPQAHSGPEGERLPGYPAPKAEHLGDVARVLRREVLSTLRLAGELVHVRGSQGAPPALDLAQGLLLDVEVLVAAVAGVLEGQPWPAVRLEGATDLGMLAGVVEAVRDEGDDFASLPELARLLARAAREALPSGA